MEHKEALAARYGGLTGARECYLNSAREVSALTLPYLIPQDDGPNSAADLPTPHQSIGARGVVNLASKLTMALMPPNSPWFRLTPNRLAIEAAGLDAEDDILEEIKQQTAKVERALHEEIEARALRPESTQAMLHLIVSGNVIIQHFTESPFIKIHGLQRFVAQRDGRGNLTLLIIRECMAPSTVPPELAEAAQKASSTNHEGEKTVDLWTAAERIDKKWFWVWQEIGQNGVKVGKRSRVKADMLPFDVLRLNRVSGEDYGRGFGEQYKGDLISLESLSESLVNMAEAASRVVPMVRHNGSTQVRDLQAAFDNPGKVIRGHQDDVSFMQMEKLSDFRVAFEEKGDIQRRLNFAFLLNSSVQRDGERVTAEEIRFMAQELEETLSGAYSTLTQEYQLPLINRLLRTVKGLPPVVHDKRIIRPVVITGAEALGRGAEFNRLSQFIRVGLETLGPEFLSVMKPLVLAERLADGAGIDKEGLFKTDEEIAQERQAAMAQQITEQAAPGVIQEGAKAALNQTQETQQ